MNLINRFGTSVYWRIFDSTDNLNWFGNAEGTLANNETTAFDVKQSTLKLEFKQSGPLSTAIVAPFVVSKDAVVLLTSSRDAVVVDGELKELLGLDGKSYANLPHEADLAALAKIATALLAAVASALGTGGKVGGGVFNFIARSYGSVPSSPLTIEEMGEVLRQIIYDNDARNASVAIHSAYRHADPLFRRAAVRGNDLPEPDRVELLSNVRSLLDPNSFFSFHLDVLKARSEVRLYALPALVLGAGLWAQAISTYLADREDRGLLDDFDRESAAGFALDMAAALKQGQRDVEARGLSLLDGAGISGTPEWSQARDAFTKKYYWGEPGSALFSALSAEKMAGALNPVTR